MEYSLALFFIKLVVITFFFWLPFYVSLTRMFICTSDAKLCIVMYVHVLCAVTTITQYMQPEHLCTCRHYKTMLTWPGIVSQTVHVKSMVCAILCNFLGPAGCALHTSLAGKNSFTSVLKGCNVHLLYLVLVGMCHSPTGGSILHGRHEIQ